MNANLYTGLPEDLQREVETESILMPASRKLRETVFFKNQSEQGKAPSEVHLRFAHYTTADAAVKIIKTKRLWMRNATCMSDYREVQHGFPILHKFFLNETLKKSFVEAVDGCFPGVAGEALSLFDRWWVNTQFSTYIASMSEHDINEDQHGRLSMWRALNGGGPRVAIVLKVPWLSTGAHTLKLSFAPVAYLTDDEVHKDIQQAIQNIRNNAAFLRSRGREKVLGWLFTMLLSHVTCLKHEAFKEEKEWRAIYSPQRVPSEFMQTSIETIGGIPQRVYSIPLDKSVNPQIADVDFCALFDRLIIGPSPYPAVLYEAFVSILTEIGIANAGNRVVMSNIPLRV